MTGTSGPRALLRLLLLAALIGAAWASAVVLKYAGQPGGMAWGPALDAFWRDWWIDLVVVFGLLVVAHGGHPRLPAGGMARRAGLVGLVLAATAVALGLLVWKASLLRPDLPLRAEMLPFHLMQQGTLALLAVAILELAHRRQLAAQALHQAALREAQGRRELDAARTALLQAQVEPHFLFNTLATVRRLVRTDPAAAHGLLAALRRYLEEALPLLRQPQATLGREAELVQAYLDVHQVRMGPRLQAQVHIPAALSSQPLPPMLLLTLVENAIKHGLAPQVDGGSIQVDARAAGGELTLTVADTGRGMGEGLGHGTGLANVRARLRAAYGEQARLSLRLNEPRGVVAAITVPMAP